MTWLYYLLEANLYLALFYAAYYLLLRRETFYQLNRFYLLVSSVVAFAIPLMQLGILKPAPAPIEAITQVAYTPYTLPAGQLAANAVAGTNNTINYYLLFYAVITVLMAVSFGIRIFQLVKLANKGHHLAGYKFHLIEIADDEHAFSFFNYLFISKKLTASDTIIRHELVHIGQRHSVDIVYLELVKIICWFNPAVYLLQNSIRELHEYIADSHIATAQEDVEYYTDFLINNAYGLPETALANNFFNKNLLKKRIMMLHQKRSGALARLKLLIALPLLGAMLCLSTLAFAKDYNLLDLLPKKQRDSINKKLLLPPPPAQPATKPGALKLPPPPPALPAVRTTSKGYNYQEDGYLVKGKTDFRVIITEKNGGQKSYFRNTATATDIKLLANKYGYKFPVMEIHPLLPPPPPMAPAAPEIDKRLPPPPPTAPKVSGQAVDQKQGVITNTNKKSNTKAKVTKPPVWIMGNLPNQMIGKFIWQASC
jgi:hypothetical protein